MAIPELLKQITALGIFALVIAIAVDRIRENHRRSG